jgi:hypothetical protein
MAAVSGTVDTLDITGMAEDVEDAIFNISPTETPFLTMAKRKKATNTLHQWQVDSLRAAAANRQLEGDEASFSSVTGTTMLGNYTQISRETVIVSRTADTVKKYGRAKELARLVVKKGRELKRDIEFALVQNQGSSTPSGIVTARSSAGFESMIVNRVFSGSSTSGTVPGQASIGVWTAPTDGSANSTLTEANLIAGIQAAWDDGGDPSVIMLPFFQKRKIAEMSGATKYAGAYSTMSGKAGGALLGSIDVYISDAGDHKLVLNRHMRTSVVFGIDPDYVSVAFLDGIQMHDLAKTGDAEKKMLVTEFCLVADNPDAHFQIRGCPAS